MRGAYALLGLAVGVILDEVLRRRVRPRAQWAGHYAGRQAQPRVLKQRCLREAAARAPRLFAAQDFYDR